MQLYLSTIIAFISAAVASAGTSDSVGSIPEPQYLNVPAEAILAASPISNDLVPVVVTKDGQMALLIVNGTLADEIASATQTNVKRDAEAWHWLSKMTFQPIF